MTLTARWGAQPVDFTVEHYYMDTTGTMPSAANETDRTSEEVDTDIEVGTLKKSGLSEAFTCVKARVSGVYGLAEDTEFTDLSATVRAAKGMTVKLYYDRAQYALEWVFNGGTASNDYTGSGGAYEIYYDTALVLPAPAKRGHDFLGWFDNETFNESGKLAEGAKMPAAAQTYYAKWTPSVYGITYPGIEGSAPDVTLPTTHTYGTATAIPDLTRTGYVFNGWVVNGEGAAQTNLTLGAEDYTGAVTLTAAWTAERYAIIYELDGGVNAAGNPGTVHGRSDHHTGRSNQAGLHLQGLVRRQGLYDPDRGNPRGQHRGKDLLCQVGAEPVQDHMEHQRGRRADRRGLYRGSVLWEPHHRAGRPHQKGLHVRRLVHGRQQFC